MNLQEQIRLDMVSAMKNREVETLSLLRVVAGEFGRKMNNGIQLPDDQVIAILRKMVENATELGNLNEVKILEKYLPQMLGDGQVKVIIAGIINKNGFAGIKDMGKVMAELKNVPVASQIDGKTASGFVKEMLS